MTIDKREVTKKMLRKMLFDMWDLQVASQGMYDTNTLLRVTNGIESVLSELCNCVVTNEPSKQ